MASDHHATSFYALLLYASVGLLAGLAATVFIQGLHRTEGLFDRIRNPYLRHVVGMLIVADSVAASVRTYT
jgi:chloride channel protein, CIC family